MSVARVFRSKWLWIALALLAVVVVVLWVALPALLTNYVNNRLARLVNYQDQVDRVSLNLWKGRYRLKNLRIEARRARKRPPALAAPMVEVSLDWGPLLRGKVVAEVDLYEPVIRSEERRVGNVESRRRAR